MASNVTETLEMSRFFLKTYLNDGEEKTKKLLEEFANAQAFGLDTKDIKELNSRLMTVVSGIMSVLYRTDTEKMIRQQLTVSENFVSEQKIEKKLQIFVKDIINFLNEYKQRKVNNRFSDEVIEYIRTCSLKELSNLTVESLAEHFGYGKSRFLAKIRPETGKTAQEVLSEERLSRAYQLLKDEPHKTVKEVAFSVGFTDSVYFSRLFKKHYNFLPSEIRNI
jgi:AraC-like DNA-binding protein